MAYSKDKDVLIKEEMIDGIFRVAIFKYSEGEQKIVIQRHVDFKDKKSGNEIEAWSNKVGRLTKSEAEKIVVVIQKMILEMK